MWDPPELIQGPSVVPNAGENKQLREKRKIVCRKHGEGTPELCCVIDLVRTTKFDTKLDILRKKNPASNTFPIFERYYPVLADKIS